MYSNKIKTVAGSCAINNCAVIDTLGLTVITTTNTTSSASMSWLDVSSNSQAGGVSFSGTAEKTNFTCRSQMLFSHDERANPHCAG